MNKGPMNLQDNFLNQVRKENIPVTIYLVSGVQLKGNVRGFDSFTLVLETPGKPAQLVYKHAMASVVPSKPIVHSMPREERPPAAAEEPREEPREEPKEEPKEESKEESKEAPEEEQTQE